MNDRNTPTISFDLDKVVMLNPFLKGIGPRIRSHIRQSKELSHLEPQEADKLIDEAVRETWGRLMREGDFVGAYNWDEIYSSVSTSFGGSPTPDVATLVRSCCEEEGMIALLRGVEHGLQLLKEHGYRLVALTNGFYAYQWPVLDALGVASYFDEVLTPDKVGYAKPDPQLFLAAGNLQAHVGDTLVHDVMGANLAGVMSIWLDPDLPDEFRKVPAEKRVQLATFKKYLSEVLHSAPYREYHPEATTENCTPDAVVADVKEAAQVILEEQATARG